MVFDDGHRDSFLGYYDIVYVYFILSWREAFDSI